MEGRQIGSVRVCLAPIRYYGQTLSAPEIANMVPSGVRLNTSTSSVQGLREVDEPPKVTTGP